MFLGDKTKVELSCSGTWVVASQARCAAKHLPQEGGVFFSVLLEHLLQSLRPVQLIQHDGGCKYGTRASKRTTEAAAVVRNAQHMTATSEQSVAAAFIQTTVATLFFFLCICQNIQFVHEQVCA